jgi:hypothetical protein
LLSGRQAWIEPISDFAISIKTDGDPGCCDAGC